MSMPNKSTKILIKVGKSSDISFRNVKAFRALSLNELDELNTKYPEAKAVVIEHITEAETEGIKDFIRRLTQKGDEYRVYFYVKDNDPVTCGIADEFEYNIYLSLDNLHIALYQNQRIEAFTSLELIKKAANQEIKSLEGVSTKVGQSTESVKKEQEAQVKAKEEPKVKETPKPKKEAAPAKKPEQKVESTKNAGDAEKLISTKEDETQKPKTSTPVKTTEKPKAEGEKIGEPKVKESQVEAARAEASKIETPKVETPKIEGVKSPSVPVPIPVVQGASKAEVEALENKILNLNTELAGLNAERASLLSAAEGLKAEVANLTARVEQTTQLKESLESELGNTTNTVRILTEKNNQLQSTINTQNQQIANLSSSSESRVTELASEVTKLKTSLESTQSTLDSKVKSLTLEISTRLKIMKLLSKGIGELKKSDESLVEKTKEIERLVALVSELESTKSSLEGNLQQSREKITELQLLADEADKRIELAKSFVQEQLDAQRIENVKLQAQYELIKAQFTAKEEQYNNLVKISGVDESGASQILLDKKYLESQVQSLREENVSLRRELEKAQEDRMFIQRNLKTLEERNSQLNLSVRTMSQGTAEGVSVSIPPINYQGKGMVLTVFGSGSYGVTTTAISMARALALQASVLYIDFDMTTAKADGIFSKNPIVKNLGIPDSTKNTGLGLLFTKGATFFLENANRIIMNIETTKGGKLDYISGVYAKMNIVDVMATDYSAFINYCSNSYTYVIMDFGRIGTSDLNDRIIKTFSDIAYRDVVVTPNDKFEVNRMGQKLKENQISMKNVAWLLNGCDSTIIDNTTKGKIQATFCYGLMLFSSDIWGRKGDFLKTKETKTRLTKFMKDIFNGQS